MKSFHPFWPIIIPTISALVIIYFTIQHEKSLFTVETEYTLNHVIAIDMNNRLEQTNEVFSFVYDPDIESKTTRSQQESNQININSEKLNRELSIQQKHQNFLQTYLLVKNPIKIFTLDSLFQSKIREKSSDIETNIVYNDNVKNTSQIKQEKFPSSIFTIKTSEIYQGVNDEISIQAYVKLPPKFFFAKSKDIYLLTVILWLVSMGVLTPIFLHRRKIVQQTSILDTHVKAITETPSSEWYKVTESLIFNPEKSSLIYQDKNIPITKQVTQILKLLLDAPEHFLSTEEIIKALWGTLHEDTRFPQAITRFRAAIKPIPELTLKNIRGKGYQLIIQQENELQEQELENKFTP